MTDVSAVMSTRGTDRHSRVRRGTYRHSRVGTACTRPAVEPYGVFPERGPGAGADTPRCPAWRAGLLRPLWLSIVCASQLPLWGHLLGASLCGPTVPHLTAALVGDRRRLGSVLRAPRREQRMIEDVSFRFRASFIPYYYIGKHMLFFVGHVAEHLRSPGWGVSQPGNVPTQLL